MAEVELWEPVDNLAERDIDLLLLEEFSVSRDFLAWFCSHAGVQDAVLEKARRNVKDADGESDIVLWVRADGQRMVVLIENKINARQQESHDERYQVRGRRLAEADQADRNLTVICAPGRYLEGLATGSAYRWRVSYEEIADWFDAVGSQREAWRRDVFRQASDPARRPHRSALPLAGVRSMKNPVLNRVLRRGRAEAPLVRTAYSRTAACRSWSG